MVQNPYCIKVCFFSLAAYPLFSKSGAVHGGAELQMYLLANLLAENKDFNVNFITGNYNQKRKIRQGNILLIRSFKLKMKEGFFKKILKAIFYFFQLIFINPDVVFTTAASATVGVSAFYCKLFGKKLLHRTAHSNDVDKTWIMENSFAGKVYKYGLEKAHKVLTQSTDHAKYLEENHNIKAIIFRNISPVTNETFEKKGFVLWVGRHASWKQPELFLQLAEKSPQFLFKMVCPVSESNKTKWLIFKEKATKLSNLQFIDSVPFSEIQTLFNTANLFVNTSQTEGFPNTFLQAAAGKTPIISLNINPDNFINDYKCGVFCNNNFEKLVTKTEYLMTHLEFQQQMGENANAYLIKMHNPENQIQYLEGILKKIVRK